MMMLQALLEFLGFVVMIWYITTPDPRGEALEYFYTLTARIRFELGRLWTRIDMLRTIMQIRLLPERRQ